MAERPRPAYLESDDELSVAPEAVYVSSEDDVRNQATADIHHKQKHKQPRLSSSQDIVRKSAKKESADSRNRSKTVTQTGPGSATKTMLTSEIPKKQDTTPAPRQVVVTIPVLKRSPATVTPNSVQANPSRSVEFVSLLSDDEPQTQNNTVPTPRSHAKPLKQAQDKSVPPQKETATIPTSQEDTSGEHDQGSWLLDAVEASLDARTEKTRLITDFFGRARPEPTLKQSMKDTKIWGIAPSKNSTQKSNTARSRVAYSTTHPLLKLNGTKQSSIPLPRPPTKSPFQQPTPASVADDSKQDEDASYLYSTAPEIPEIPETSSPKRNSQAQTSGIDTYMTELPVTPSRRSKTVTFSSPLVSGDPVRRKFFVAPTSPSPDSSGVDAGSESSSFDALPSPTLISTPDKFIDKFEYWSRFANDLQDSDEEEAQLNQTLEDIDINGLLDSCIVSDAETQTPTNQPVNSPTGASVGSGLAQPYYTMFGPYTRSSGNEHPQSHESDEEDDMSTYQSSLEDDSDETAKTRAMEESDALSAIGTAALKTGQTSQVLQKAQEYLNLTGSPHKTASPGPKVDTNGIALGKRMLKSMYPPLESPIPESASLPSTIKISKKQVNQYKKLRTEGKKLLKLADQMDPKILTKGKGKEGDLVYELNRINNFIGTITTQLDKTTYLWSMMHEKNWRQIRVKDCRRDVKDYKKWETENPQPSRTPRRKSPDGSPSLGSSSSVESKEETSSSEIDQLKELRDIRDGEKRKYKSVKDQVKKLKDDRKREEREDREEE